MNELEKLLAPYIGHRDCDDACNDKLDGDELIQAILNLIKKDYIQFKHFQLAIDNERQIANERVADARIDDWQKAKEYAEQFPEVEEMNGLFNYAADQLKGDK